LRGQPFFFYQKIGCLLVLTKTRGNNFLPHGKFSGQRELKMKFEPAKNIRIERTKNYLIAIDGVLVKSNQMIPGAGKFIQQLQEHGVGFLLLTNNSRHTPDDTAIEMRKMGFVIQAANIFTSALATARYLATQKPGGSAFVVGEDGLMSAVQEIGYEITDQDPDFVVVGGSKRYDIDQITKAINLIHEGAHFICTNPDRLTRTKNGLIPASGSMAALIEEATGVSPFFIGKPNPIMTRYALNYLGVHSEETVMIGDKLDIDIIAGLQSGMETILVLSGGTLLEDLSFFAYQPHFIVRSVADLQI
jgi:NagD protein